MARVVSDVPSTESSSPRPDGPTRAVPGMWWSYFRGKRRGLLGLAGFAVFILAWQLAFTIGFLNPLLVGQPLGTVQALFDLLFVDRELLPHIRVSAVTLAGGLAIGVGSAMILGMLIGFFRWLDEMTEPLVGAFYATPYVAFLPVIILLFGISQSAKISIVVWATFFPMLINTIAGVKNTPREFIRLARSFSAGRLRLFRTIIGPSSVPYLLAGIRQATGRGLVAVIVAEFFLANRGLGYFISFVSAGYRMNEAFAAIAIASITGLIMVRFVSRVERRVSERWGLSVES